MDKTYTLYKHTSPSGKVYIGITCNPTYKRWWRGKGYKDNPYFTAAINKYGWDAFKHEILRTGLTKEQAEIAEIATIRHYKARDKRYGYNLAKGGKLSTLSADSRKRVSEANTGRANPNRGTCHYARDYKIEITQAQIEKYIDANARKKAVLCVETGVIYRSVREAERKLHICHSGIARVCNGVARYKTCGGYHWEYVNDNTRSKEQANSDCA
jgi:hypothetical protein